MQEFSIEAILKMSESEDHRQRAAAEYLFVKDKYEKLHRMIVKREAGKLDFEPDCPMEQWKAQAAAMGAYLFQLEIKAEYEEYDPEYMAQLYKTEKKLT